MMHAPLRSRLLATAICSTLALSGVSYSLPQDAAPAAPASEPAPAQSENATKSNVIEGRVDPYSYAPKNTEGHTDVDLRGIFEGLGPVAIEWYQHVLTLSNPFFEGRVPASRGSLLAGEYIEFYFS